MSDRGLPIVDGAPACPFVAFEDDRDARSTAPDHRHRCFAEPRPAPRALAHQEAYCLASAFPVCPTFQDWARREAAAARPAPGRPAPVAAPAPVPEPVSQPLPPLDREPYRAPEDVPARNPQRDWAAPPPWAAGAAAGAAAVAGQAPAGPAPETTAGGSPVTPDARDATPPEARGLAGSAADRLAGPDPSDPYSPAPTRDPWAAGSDRYPPAEDPAAAPASPGWSTPAPRELDETGAGLAGTAGLAAAGATGAAAWADDLDDEPDWVAGDRGAPESGPAPAPRQPVPDTRPVAPPNPKSQVSERRRQDPADLFGPAWERPRRNEAYPSLRTRVGLPAGVGVGRVGIAALALIVAAFALFFIGPMLLGIGSDDTGDAGSGSTAAPTEQLEPTPPPEPTPVPEPTPQVYIVKKNDTFSKIANKFDIPLEQLIAANPQIKNPDRISIGDEVIIPVPEADSGTVDGASAAP